MLMDLSASWRKTCTCNRKEHISCKNSELRRDSEGRPPQDRSSGDARSRRQSSLQNRHRLPAGTVVPLSQELQIVQICPVVEWLVAGSAGDQVERGAS